MPFRATVYRVLIASPSHAKTDRTAAAEAISDWKDVRPLLRVAHGPASS
jgi:hypothetical protein